MKVQDAVVVRPSELGNAVFAARHFEAGVQIGTVTGKVVRDPDYESEYCVEFGDGKSLETDPPYRFLNHSCDPNCELIIWEGDDPEDCELGLHSIKAIQAGEELTIDYAWPSHAAIPCLCRSAICRGWIVSQSDLPYLQA